MNTDKTLEKILNKIESMDNKIESMDNKIESMDNKIKSMDSKLDRIENRVNATFEQTAGLSEFRTEANEKLNDIKDDIEFINKKEAENEKDIFKLKKKIL